MGAGSLARGISRISVSLKCASSRDSFGKNTLNSTLASVGWHAHTPPSLNALKESFCTADSVRTWGNRLGTTKMTPLTAALHYLRIEHSEIHSDDMSPGYCPHEFADVMQKARYGDLVRNASDTSLGSVKSSFRTVSSNSFLR